MKKFQTEQEEFWAGEFGDAYIERNESQELFASNLAFFGKILKGTRNVRSVIEFGANIGLNLKAIQRLIPKCACSAVEINQRAVEILKRVEGIKVYCGSMLDFDAFPIHDLVLVKGVLIHINPEKLKEVYSILWRTSGQYICIAEYYNPTPVSVSYRGYQDRLFKRDFAGEMLAAYPDLELVNYGFVYHRDPLFPQGDITWLLLRKTNQSISCSGADESSFGLKLVK